MPWSGERQSANERGSMRPRLSFGVVLSCGVALGLLATLGTPEVVARAGQAAKRPTQIRSSYRVAGLGVGGSTVAFTGAGGCGRLTAWVPGRGSTPITASVVDACETAWYDRVAVTDDGAVVWIAGSETMHVYVGVYVARPSKPRTATTLYDGADVDLPIAVAADGKVVAFTTGPLSGGGRSTLWVGDTRRVRAIRRALGLMEDVVVQGRQVAVTYRNGRVEVFETNGNPIRFLPAGTGPRGIALVPGRLVAASERGVSVFDLRSGRLTGAHPFRRPGTRLVLQDADRGYVVYRDERGLWLLRLSDGREVRLPVPSDPAGLDEPSGPSLHPSFGPSVHARFGAQGLVISHGNVVRLIRTAALRRLLSG